MALGQPVRSGKGAALEKDPNNPGSLGLAISEAAEVAATSGGTKKYSLGSGLGHVLTEGPERHWL